MGNTRVVITDDYNVSSPILEASSYYPFGLSAFAIMVRDDGGDPMGVLESIYNLLEQAKNEGSPLPYEIGGMYDKFGNNPMGIQDTDEKGKHNARSVAIEGFEGEYIEGHYHPPGISSIAYQDTSPSPKDKNNANSDLKAFFIVGSNGYHEAEVNHNIWSSHSNDPSRYAPDWGAAIYFSHYSNGFQVPESRLKRILKKGKL